MTTFIKGPSTYQHKKMDSKSTLDGTGPQKRFINTTTVKEVHRITTQITT